MSNQSKEDLKNVVRTYVLEHILQGEDAENLTDKTRLVSDGILDSLASLKLVAYLEETFGVKIEAHEVDVDHLDSFDRIADLLISKRAKSEIKA